MAIGKPNQIVIRPDEVLMAAEKTSVTSRSHSNQLAHLSKIFLQQQQVSLSLPRFYLIKLKVLAIENQEAMPCITRTVPRPAIYFLHYYAHQQLAWKRKTFCNLTHCDVSRAFRTACWENLMCVITERDLYHEVFVKVKRECASWLDAASPKFPLYIHGWNCS